MIFQCSACKHKLRARVDQASRQVRCPACQAEIQVPGERAKTLVEAARNGTASLSEGTAGRPEVAKRDSLPNVAPRPQPPTPLLAQPAEAPDHPQTQNRPEERLGQRLALLYLLALLLTLYVQSAHSVAAWLRWGVAGILFVVAVPAVLVVWPRPIAWLGWLLEFVGDGARAGAAWWENLSRRCTRQVWEDEERLKLAAQVREWEAAEQARFTETMTRFQAERQRQVEQETLALRKRDQERLQRDVDQWTQREQARRAREEQSWNQTRQKLVEQAVKDAQEQARKDYEERLRVWLDQKKEDRLGEVELEVQRERAERLGDLELELEAWQEEQKSNWLAEGSGPVHIHWTEDWLAIAEIECPECLRSFWADKLGDQPLDEALVCRCGCPYHPACLEMLLKLGHTCHAKPGAHSAAGEFRKITRWRGGKRPAVAASSVNPNRGSLRIGAAGPKETPAPPPTNDRRAAARFRIT